MEGKDENELETSLALPLSSIVLMTEDPSAIEDWQPHQGKG